MINGMYLSTMGAMVQNARHGTIANNLANTNTTGFKPDWTIFRAIPAESLIEPGHRAEVDRILEQTGGGAWLERTQSDFTAGAFRYTGNPLDLAIDDAMADKGMVGFFMVRPGGENGDVFYTRDGHLTINSEHQLVNVNGALILSPQGSSIQIPANATNINIDEHGNIRNAADNAIVGQIGLVRTSQAEKMKKVGDNLFSREDAELVSDQRGIRAGSLEESAANPIMEMVSMIEGFRTYEANMKFIQLQDETLGDTVRRIAAVA